MPTTSEYIKDVRCGPKVGQIIPKMDKSRTFSEKVSVHTGI